MEQVATTGFYDLADAIAFAVAAEPQERQVEAGPRTVTSCSSAITTEPGPTAPLVRQWGLNGDIPLASTDFDG